MVVVVKQTNERTRAIGRLRSNQLLLAASTRTSRRQLSKQKQTLTTAGQRSAGTLQRASNPNARFNETQTQSAAAAAAFLDEAEIEEFWQICIQIWPTNCCCCCCCWCERFYHRDLLFSLVMQLPQSRRRRRRPNFAPTGDLSGLTRRLQTADA